MTPWDWDWIVIGGFGLVLGIRDWDWIGFEFVNL